MEEKLGFGGHNFGAALDCLKRGCRVWRKGWNGKGMWIVLIRADEYEVEAYAKFNSDSQLPWIGMRTADGGFVPWLASQTDLLADDWGGEG